MISGLVGATVATGTPGAGAAALPQASLARLRTALGDRLVLPGQPAYEGARWSVVRNPDTDKRPAAIVRCAGSDDVVRALEFAQAAGLEVSVRAGGHDVLGASASDGGLLIDLALLSEVTVDPVAQTVVTGAGARSGQLTLAAEPHQLAPVLGCNAVVGVTGLTLGGGYGWLVGAHGASCDHLLEAEIVTPDGRRRTIGPQASPDLFWAVRGGGGNFGVVTRMRLRLQPASQVLAGAVAFRCDPRRFLAFYRDFMAEAPDPLTVELTITPGDPPMVMAACCWCGDLAAGERALRPLRVFDKPVFERLGPIGFGRFAALAGGPAPGGLYWRGGSFDALSDAAIERLAAVVATAPSNASIGLGHYQHGVVCRPAAETALPRRAGQLSYFMGVGWDAPGPVAEAGMAWVSRAMAELHGVSSQRAYVNYLSEDDEAAVRGSYGGNGYARLSRIKRRYDPANLLHRNRNVRPA
jgi:FAD/FMN-containing dehydrogenase